MAKRTQKIQNPFVDVKAGAEATKAEITALQLVVEHLNTSLNAIKANAKALKAELGGKSGNNLADMLAMNDAMAKAIELQRQEQAVKKAQQAQEAQLIKLYEKAERDKERRIAKEIADNKRKEAQYNKEIAQAEKLAKKLEQEGQAYNRVNGWLKKLSDEHRNLAIKKELGGKLTADEIKRMATLEARIKKYDSALKAVDATQGKHQRNVGNYSGAWNGLGNSVQQLTRELPAFANSMQTGFMAISNNLPIFFDEIKRIREANVGLAESGQPTVSAFREIGKSIFSITGLLGLAVTLLTFFGSSIAKAVEEAIWGHQKTKEELEKENEEKKRAIKIQQDLNKKRKEGFEFVGRESAGLIGLLVGLRHTNQGSKERIKLLGILNKDHKVHIANLKNEGKFQEMVNKTIFDYINYQRQAYRIKFLGDLMEKNIAGQEETMYKLKKSLALTTKEFDMLAEHGSQAFVSLAQSIQGGEFAGMGGNLDEVAEKTGLTVTRLRQLRSVFTGKDQSLSNGLNKTQQELVDMSFAMAGFINRADAYGIGIGEAKLATQDWENSLVGSSDKLDRNTTSLNDNNITLENYIDNLKQLEAVVKAINDIDKDFRIKILDETILAETENIRNKILAGEEYSRDAITDLYNQRYELQISLLDDELAYKTKVNQESLDKEKRQSILELNEKRKQLIEDINKSKWGEDQKAKDRLAVQASYQIELLKLESIYGERQKVVDAERIKENKAYQVSVYELEKETRDKTNQLNKDINQDVSDALDLRLKEITDYYANEKLILLKSKKTKEEISREEIINKRAELEEKIWLEKQAGNDSTDLQIQLAELNRAEKERQLEQEKKHYEKLVQFGKKSADELLNYQIKKSQEKQKIIDSEISDSEKQADLLAQKASQGNLLAEESLKKQQEITNKYRDKRQKEEEREQRLEQAKKFVEMATNITNSLIQKGGEPIGSAGKAIGLVATIKALFGGGFKDGTDMLGDNGKGLDGQGGRLILAHKKERIMTEGHNQALINANGGKLPTNDYVVKAFQLMNSPRMILPNIQTTTDVTHAPILREQLAKLDEMNSKLDRIPNEFFSEEVIDGVLKAVHQKQVGNTINKRYIGS